MARPVSTAQGGRSLRATYRLQFNERFRLADALAIVPYLHELGVTHIYASPLTKATPHSPHGYDVCDFGQLNPELGTEAELEELVAALHGNGMGLVLDIVPNHMGIGPNNPWWWDVLTYGRQSAFAKYFDIDWESSDPRIRGKVLLPVLGDRYSKLLEEKQITIELRGNVPLLRYGDHCLPVAPGFPIDEAEAKTTNEDPAALDRLIQRQNYCLVFWKRADTDLNYRRFFSIASLVGLRMEDPTVFDDAHALVKKWLQKGWLDGLRVDHPDGLRDPGAYLNQLRALAPRAWLVIEKILQPGEALPSRWPVAGTSGYDFLNQVNALFVNAESARVFTDFYAEFTGEPTDYDRLWHDKKRAALDTLFRPEINRLLTILLGIADRHWQWRDCTAEELRDALSELTACFPVYRIYGGQAQEPLDPSEASCVESSVALAQQHKPDLPREVFAMLRAILLGDQDDPCASEFKARFQQLTGPAMAKGVEDTAFYCFNRFISVNEVGGDPGRLGASVEAFHQYCAIQQRSWPNAMLASSTHDTKRSEDVRARLNVLSEIPEKWTATVRRWAQMNSRYRRDGFPDRNAEYHFYQTLVGAWPLSCERLWAYMEKAVREAKQHTNWSQPNAAYEQGLRYFVEAAMHHAEFLEDAEKLVASVARAGLINSLSQTLLKLTAPGVPDFYQGSELWNLHLVDPDNRQPVDFECRRHLLAQAKTISAQEAWHRDDAGLVKLWLTWKVLNIRAAGPDRFAGQQRYEPLLARGAKRAHVVAFMRGHDAITVVQRLPLTVHNQWGDTVLDLPKGSWRNALAGSIVAGPNVSLADLLKAFPVALLIRE